MSDDDVPQYSPLKASILKKNEQFQEQIINQENKIDEKNIKIQENEKMIQISNHNLLKSKVELATFIWIQFFFSLSIAVLKNDNFIMEKIQQQNFQTIQENEIQIKIQKNEIDEKNKKIEEQKKMIILEKTKKQNFQKIEETENKIKNQENEIDELKNNNFIMEKTQEQNLQTIQENEIQMKLQKNEIVEKNKKIQKKEEMIQSLNHDLLMTKQKLSNSEWIQFYYQISIGGVVFFLGMIFNIFIFCNYFRSKTTTESSDDEIETFPRPHYVKEGDSIHTISTSSSIDYSS